MNCDTTNSRPRPSAQWFNPAGQLVSTERAFAIPVVLRNQSGVYTCVAVQLATGLNMSSTVDVIVQCECVFVHVDILLKRKGVLLS